LLDICPDLPWSLEMLKHSGDYVTLLSSFARKGRAEKFQQSVR